MAEAFLSTAQLAEMLGESRTTAWRVCKDNLGFSMKFGRSYKVPLSHYERVRRGETPAAIAADIKSSHGQQAA
jgi:hypothetical protein